MATIVRPITRTRVTSAWGQSVADWVNNSPSPWVPIVLQNGWVWYGGAFGTPQIRLDRDKNARLMGLVTKSAAPVYGEIIGTIPTGYRPPFQILLTCTTSYGSQPAYSGRVDVQPSGTLSMMFAGQAGQFIAFDTITYPAV